MNHTSLHDLDSVLMAIDTATCESYRVHVPLMVAYANQQIVERTHVTDLLGSCPIDMVYNLHADHARLMVAQLEIKSVSTLISTVAWEYQLFLSRGVSLEFFLLDFAIWIEAINQHLDAPSSLSERRW